jgi:phosphate transport system substrate-binding protein
METAPKYIFLGLLTLVVGTLAAIGLFHRGNSEPPLLGGGSTFIAPLMVQWSSEFEKTEHGCRVGYRSLGSGTGIRLFINNKVLFACSDAPMTDEQLAQARKTGSDVAHIPLVLGAVVPVYNLPDLSEPLRFTGAVLADIYVGKIKKWNDAALVELNPRAKLPDREIGVVHRKDSSGTTYIWTDYLSKVSPRWKETIGAATDVKWPTGTAEDGNQGVAEKVQKSAGSIGYVELTYAYQLELAVGLVQNREGEYIKANLASIAKAADNALVEIPDDLRFSLTDAPGKGSYPITGTTWAIVRLQPDKKRAHYLVDFLTWATGDGQAGVQTLLYGKLPTALLERSRQKIAQIKVD